MKGNMFKSRRGTLFFLYAKCMRCTCARPKLNDITPENVQDCSLTGVSGYKRKRTAQHDEPRQELFKIFVARVYYQKIGNMPW